jgi:hypothetical protein
MAGNEFAVTPDMSLDSRQARITLLLFLAILMAGQGWQFLNRPIYPDPTNFSQEWPPQGYLLDATVLNSRALEAFRPGTTVNEALKRLGVEPAIRGSGFCLPGAGVLYRADNGWRIRPMSQLERHVWRLPMQITNCTTEDLERIRGVGPVLGRKIHSFVQERAYIVSLDELDAIHGVGSKKLAVLKKELVVN